MKEILLTGRDIKNIIPDLSLLRITVFREFPYLYDGSLDYEYEYLQRYAERVKSMVFAVYDGNLLVGATTATPLSEEDEEIRAPFDQLSIPTENYLYFGESMLLKEYRGRGLGNRFFDIREKYASDFPEINSCCFCAVERPETHPLKPEDYRSNELFWKKRNYTKQPELQCQMSWQDIDNDIETKKTLTFWSRTWK